jgi:hypothetical protein
MKRKINKKFPIGIDLEEEGPSCGDDIDRITQEWLRGEEIGVNFNILPLHLHRSKKYDVVLINKS